MMYYAKIGSITPASIHNTKTITIALEITFLVFELFMFNIKLTSTLIEVKTDFYAPLCCLLTALRLHCSINSKKFSL